MEQVICSAPWNNSQKIEWNIYSIPLHYIQSIQIESKSMLIPRWVAVPNSYELVQISSIFYFNCLLVVSRVPCSLPIPNEFESRYCDPVHTNPVRDSLGVERILLLWSKV